jgi:hypothetical protein
MDVGMMMDGSYERYCNSQQEVSRIEEKLEKGLISVGKREKLIFRHKQLIREIIPKHERATRLF